MIKVLLRDKVSKREYDKQYYINNKELITERCAKWYQDNKENRNEQQTKYRLSHKKRGNEFTRKYSKTEKGKIANKRKQLKRQRNLGFLPFNKYFEGSEAHHISENFIIYIPLELHKSIQHNIWTWEGMEVINNLAFGFL